MKKGITLIFLIASLTGGTTKSPGKRKVAEEVFVHEFDSTEMTNNFYDNTETCQLHVRELTITGEIRNPGPVDLSKLVKHSVIVKEALLNGTDSNRFVGAFRYDGYSLFDILNDRIPEKTNSGEFNPIIDLNVEIENEMGEKAVFSWGEIYYPVNLHRVIIASGVSRIVPSKTKDLWEIPVGSRIVAANDLITERNISSPVKITVRSFPRSFPVAKGLSPMYSAGLSLFDNGRLKSRLQDKAVNLNEITYNTVFYGRGRGIHSTSPFTGVTLKDLLIGHYPLTRERLRSGIMCIASVDGYRCAMSYSELFNRNDQQEFLMVRTEKGEDGGLFRLFPAADFFSDRAVKSINEIHLGY